MAIRETTIGGLKDYSVAYRNWAAPQRGGLGFFGSATITAPTGILTSFAAFENLTLTSTSILYPMQYKTIISVSGNLYLDGQIMPANRSNGIDSSKIPSDVYDAPFSKCAADEVGGVVQMLTDGSNAQGFFVPNFPIGIVPVEGSAGGDGADGQGNTWDYSGGGGAGGSGLGFGGDGGNGNTNTVPFVGGAGGARGAGGDTRASVIFHVAGKCYIGDGFHYDGLGSYGADAGDATGDAGGGGGGGGGCGATFGLVAQDIKLTDYNVLNGVKFKMNGGNGGNGGDGTIGGGGGGGGSGGGGGLFFARSFILGNLDMSDMGFIMLSVGSLDFQCTAGLKGVKGASSGAIPAFDGANGIGGQMFAMKI